MFWFWIWLSKNCRLHDVSHQKSLSDRRCLIKIPQFFIQQKCFHIFYGRMSQQVFQVLLTTTSFSSVLSCEDLLISSFHRSANMWIFIYLKSLETVFFRTEQRKISFNSSFSTDSDCDENIAFNFYPQGARQSPRKGTCIHVVNKHNLCIRLRLSLTAMVTTATSIHLNKHGKFLIQERSQLSATKAIFGV